MKFTSKKDTEKWVKEQAKTLHAGDVVRLDGDLGSGKTQFVQWIGESLGVKSPITSPTFSLLQSYETDRGKIYHLDLYRLEDPQEIEEIDFEDCFYSDSNLTFIEWAERAEDYLPRDYIHIEIIKGEGEEREIICRSDHDNFR